MHVQVLYKPCHFSSTFSLLSLPTMPIECNIPNDALHRILAAQIVESRRKFEDDPTFLVFEGLTADLIAIENSALLMAGQPPLATSNAAAAVSYLGNPPLMYQQYLNMDEQMQTPQGIRLWVHECYVRREEQKIGLIMFWSGEQV